MPYQRMKGINKYLGNQQAYNIRTKENKDSILGESWERGNTIVNTYLNANNKLTAKNTLALPVTTYFFGTINWSNTELQAFDRKLRTTFQQQLFTQSSSLKGYI